MCDPSSHTRDRMDVRMTWFVFRVLEILGYRHISDSARERLHRDMASQAERGDLWMWSVFGVPIFQILALYLNVVGAKNIHIL